jgi:hypothetical protein
LVVVANEPAGAVVVVVPAVIAVVKKYKPATALAAAAVPLEVMLGEEMLVAVTVSRVEAPVTVKLSNEGSAKATPTAFVFGIIFSFIKPAPKGGVLH